MIFLAALLVFAPLPWLALAMRADHLAKLRQETVDMFYHGFSNYMLHAFPEDELRPLTCQPLTRTRGQPPDYGIDDVLGNYSLTLIDSLSTLAILAGGPADEGYTGSKALRDFHGGVEQFVRHYGDGRPGVSGQGLRARGFDLDSKVQVFETVIRGVGGLLSAHLFAVGHLPIRGYDPTPDAAPHPDDDDDDDDDPLETPPITWPGGFRYDGQLLRLAFDLAQRLLPAFYTRTGIPYPRVNLRSGIPFYVNSPLHQDAAASDDNIESNTAGTGFETTETCSAGAGSLTLEFTVLSRLSGDPRFELAAKRAFWEVWERRSDIGLIGNGIDAERGVWTGPHSGIGAGMDSFFEYALKSHILLSGRDAHNASLPPRRRRRRQSTMSWLDPNSLHPPLSRELHSSDAFLEAWHQAHASVKRYIYTDRSHFPYYSNTHRATGQPYTMWIDSLGAFYPGLLALAGEVDEAVEANLVYTALWTRYSALPERWSVREGNVEPGIAWWPGRPEFIESTYHIYRATADPWYLRVGEMVLRDVKGRCWTVCGWAGLEDVRTGEQKDRMESFFLGETTKYLYLLFDPAHPLNSLDAAYVFTTEGHPLIIPPRPRRPSATRHKQAVQEEEAVAAAEGGYKYFDSRFTNTCPTPPKPADPLAGSVTAARRNLFDVSLLTELYKTPNMRGPVEAYEAQDEKQGGLVVTRLRATSNHSVFPWTLPPSMLPHDGTCPAPVKRIVSWIQFPAAMPSSKKSPSSSSSSSAGAASSLLARLFEPKPPPMLRWTSKAGPLVNSVDGLRLQLERESRGGGDDEDVWVVKSAAGNMLRKGESLFFHAEQIGHFGDEAFSVLRRGDVVEILVLMEQETEAEMTKKKKKKKTGKRSLASMALITSELEFGNNTTAATTTTIQSGSCGKEALVSSSSKKKDTAVCASDEPPVDEKESFLQSLLRVVSSALDPSAVDRDPKSSRKTRPPRPPPPASVVTATTSKATTATTAATNSDGRSKPRIYRLTARTATGPGASRLPSVADTLLPTSPGYSAADPAASFPWRRRRRRRRRRQSRRGDEESSRGDEYRGIYLAGLACDHTLPASAPRDNQVIVMRRGGCSFAEKLANIPAAASASTTTTTTTTTAATGGDGDGDGLQLLIVVDDNDDDDDDEGSAAADDASSAVRPLLETEQRTPDGGLRAHGIPLVLVSGPRGTYERFGRAEAVGLRRKYVVRSQGYFIANAVIL